MSDTRTTRTTLVLAVTLATTLVLPAAAAQDPQVCRNVQTATEDTVVALGGPGHPATVWLWPHEDKYTATLGRQADSTQFQEVAQVKIVGTSAFKTVRVTTTQDNEKLAIERLRQEWVQGWLGLSVAKSRITLVFQAGDTTSLQLSLAAPQLENVTSVRVTNHDYATDCPGLQLQEPTTIKPTTTTQATTTSATTTQATTTSATTTQATTTSATTTQATTTSATTNPAIKTTTTMQPPTTTILSLTPTVDSVSWGEGCGTPLWSWAVAGVAAALLVAVLVLICLTCVLCRRNYRLERTIARQSQSMRGRAPGGGYGIETNDVEYYGLNNTNLMLGSTIARLPSPSPTPSPYPSHALRDLRRTISHQPPSHSLQIPKDFRRSLSHLHSSAEDLCHTMYERPPSPSLSPRKLNRTCSKPTLSFPPPPSPSPSPLPPPPDCGSNYSGEDTLR